MYSIMKPGVGTSTTCCKVNKILFIGGNHVKTAGKFEPALRLILIKLVLIVMMKEIFLLFMRR